MKSIEMGVGVEVPKVYVYIIRCIKQDIEWLREIILLIEWQNKVYHGKNTEVQMIRRSYN